MMREHVQMPVDATDGDKVTCWCGVVYQYTVLNDGYAEWVQVEGDS